MEFNLKPGTYYIGDPSYVTKGNEGWQWLEGIWKELYASVDKCIFTTFEGVELFVGRTYGGDGIFGDFFVDSGAISIIKIDNLNNDPRFNFRNNSIKGAKFVILDYEAILYYDKGEFKIDGIVDINTEF